MVTAAEKKAAAEAKEAAQGKLVIALSGDITLRIPVGQSSLPVGTPTTAEAIEQVIKTELGRSGAIVHVELKHTNK